MTAEPPGEESGPPTSADAARILAELSPVTQRSWRLARDAMLARPLLAWGLAWAAGAIVYQFVAGPAGAALGTAACAAAAAATWAVRPRDVRLGSERRFALIWVVFLAISPLLVAVAAPANAHLMVVFLASLWAVAMLLYGLSIQDLPLAAVGLVTLVVAAAARIFAPRSAVLAVGIAGGLAMAGLGGWRMRWKTGRPR
jgi:hypothetical protein